jgi:capsular exopolysaccharide synthesis family protein
VSTAIDVFYRYRSEKRKLQRKQQILVYTEEMGRMLRDMTEFNDRMRAFVMSSRLPEVEASMERLKQVPEQLQQVRTRLAMLERAQSELRKENKTVAERLSIIATLDVGRTLKPGEGISSLGDGEEDGVLEVDNDVIVTPWMSQSRITGWEEDHKALEELAVKREELLTQNYLALHPKIAALDNEIKELREGLEGMLNGASDQLEWEISKLEAHRTDLEKKIPMNRAAMNNYEAIMWEFEQLGVTEFPWKEKYLEMARKIAELEYAAETPFATRLEYMGIVDRCRHAVSPNRGKLLVMSLGMGLALCVAFVFVIEYLDHTISRVDKAEQVLSMRGLGIVPQLPSSLTDVNEIPLLTDGESEFGRARSSVRETFRVIRANIMESRDFEGDRQVIMVTSSIPKEGKSLVSSNLALSFASVGEKTLLIDADIRRRSLSRTFNRGSGRGLSDVLKNYTTLDDACVLTDHDYLHLLAAGTLTSQAPELLAGANFTQLMQELRQRYQRIILDTPPILGLSEACEVLRCVDGVVLVIWSAYTPMHQVKDSTALMRANGARFFGFVLNRLDLSGAKNYYQYYYYSDYYYRSYSS